MQGGFGDRICNWDFKLPLIAETSSEGGECTKNHVHHDQETYDDPRSLAILILSMILIWLPYETLAFTSFNHRKSLTLEVQAPLMSLAVSNHGLKEKRHLCLTHGSWAESCPAESCSKLPEPFAALRGVGSVGNPPGIHTWFKLQVDNTTRSKRTNSKLV